MIKEYLIRFIYAITDNKLEGKIQDSRTVDIHYEKNPMYRTIFTDGAIGGVTPVGQINLSFYATRQAIPKSITHELAKDGVVMNEIKISDDSKSGIIREIEVGVYMNMKSAKDLYEFFKKIFEHDNK